MGQKISLQCDPKFASCLLSHFFVALVRPGPKSTKGPKSAKGGKGSTKGKLLAVRKNSRLF